MDVRCGSYLSKQVRTLLPPYIKRTDQRCFENIHKNYQIWKSISLIKWTLSLTHWGRVTHICVNELTIIGSYNGLLPGWHQAIIWTNAGILLIGPLGTNFSEILIVIQIFHSRKCTWKCDLRNASILSWPQCVWFVTPWTEFMKYCVPGYQA